MVGYRRLGEQGGRLLLSGKGILQEAEFKLDVSGTRPWLLGLPAVSSLPLAEERQPTRFPASIPLLPHPPHAPGSPPLVSASSRLRSSPSWARQQPERMERIVPT